MVVFIALFAALTLSTQASRSAQQDEAVRRAFLDLIDRPRAPLDPELTELPSVRGLLGTHFTFAAESGQRVPGLLIKRSFPGGKRPVIIVLHSTGGNKNDQFVLLKQFADRGFIGVAIDGRYHGERNKKDETGSEYEQAILRAYRSGKEHPFLYDAVWDVMRLIDYLVTRDDVDPNRIGLIGISKGGMETYLAAAVDPRIAVAIPFIGVQSFRWALDNDAWQPRVKTFQSAVDGAAQESGAAINAEFVRKFYDRVAPGIYAQFDAPSMLPLIAPRPLMVVNGDRDERTPRAGVEEAAEKASQAYEAAEAKDKFVLLLEPDTGHAVTADALEQAVNWLVKWLKPGQKTP